MPNILIPVRFYGFDSIMYTLSALIGFLVSYYAFKLYNTTNKKSHFYLQLAFTILSIGLLTLGLTSGYTYLNYFILETPGPIDQIVYVDDFGYWIYYLSSLVAYSVMALVYISEKSRFLIFLPAWHKGMPYFNVLSFFILSYVIFRSIVNFVAKKKLSSFLVMSSFILIGAYHILLFLASFSKLFYVAAHLSLITGFGCLLLMLIRVKRGWK